MEKGSEFLKLIEIVQPINSIGIKLHTFIRNEIPNVEETENIDKKRWYSFKKEIEEYFKWRQEHQIKWRLINYDGQAKEFYCIHIEEGITLYFESSEGIKLIYDSKSDQKLVEQLKNKINKLKKKHSRFTIGFVQSEMSTLRIRFREFKPYENDLTKFLGNDFLEFEEQLVSDINQNNRSGLYLLHGKPGTGKTSFIKSVLSKVEKHAIFITPALTESLTSPELVGLLLDHPESIIIIEDAETVLMKRQADNSNAVSNLLNLTDGFPADFLNLNIICTFNTNIDNIDPALLRKGRLSGIKEFQKLKPDQANSLAKEMGYTLNTNSPMTLAEVCNVTGKKYQVTTNGIGF
ncbi:MAG: AAA family ATPase [Balneola sp.]